MNQAEQIVVWMIFIPYMLGLLVIIWGGCLISRDLMSGKEKKVKRVPGLGPGRITRVGNLSEGEVIPLEQGFVEKRVLFVKKKIPVVKLYEVKAKRFFRDPTDRLVELDLENIETNEQKEAKLEGDRKISAYTMEVY
ncbi:gp34.64 [Bacillus phage SPO1]|uniref:Gp34.64 n=1 Tax=Bacillus phage SP01 TaxID=2884427 RepID=B6V310_BPSP1|nr:gp34.64 [Bacillus phage SPO1]ACI91092.1 gp34.64 [Bacillus phage SPO1]